MTSINQSLSPDTLFNTFKHLDCIGTTRARRVCKQWFKIIDQHKSFWRTLHLPEDSFKKWDPSILELFDDKSGSTLQDVDIEMRREHEDQIFNILQKSKQTLKHLFLRLHPHGGNIGQDFLQSFVAVESLRVKSGRDHYKVRLRRSSIKRGPQEDGSNIASSLRVLWCGTDRSIFDIDSTRFENLVSLDTRATLSSSDWRAFLEGPSRNLKHLRLGFRNGRYEDHSGVPSLLFPNLEVLELNSAGEFPHWLLVPYSAKLIAHSAVYNLPSISELWTWEPIFQVTDIIERLPKLKTLCSLSYAFGLEDVLRLLNERKVNVEAGLQVKGVEMEMIKTLIIPYDLCEIEFWDQDPESLERCKEMVQVVGGDAHPNFIEVEF